MNLRASLPPLPLRIKRLPLDPERGYPVPFFVQWFRADNPNIPTDSGVGRPDYRVTDTRKLRAAMKENRCWICGDFLGSYFAFNIGPMCAINKITSEPPSHRECAIFAAQACPFLNNPEMRRRSESRPAGTQEPAGIHLERNPGVVLVWITRSFQPFRAQGGHAGILFKLGDPVELLWFSEGRQAKRSEIIQSLESGFPTLHEAAMLDGADAVRAMEDSYKHAIEELVPR